jgi:hypothetical protein
VAKRKRSKQRLTREQERAIFAKQGMREGVQKFSPLRKDQVQAAKELLKFSQKHPQRRKKKLRTAEHALQNLLDIAFQRQERHAVRGAEYGPGTIRDPKVWSLPKGWNFLGMGGSKFALAHKKSGLVFKTNFSDPDYENTRLARLQGKRIRVTSKGKTYTLRVPKVFRLYGNSTALVSYVGGRQVTPPSAVRKAMFRRHNMGDLFGDNVKRGKRKRHFTVVDVGDYFSRSNRRESSTSTR